MFATAFIPANKVAPVVLSTHAESTPSTQYGSIQDAHVHTFDGSGWKEIYFTGGSISVEEGEESLDVRLTNCTDVEADFLPLIYTVDLSRTMGSQFFRAKLHGGYLTIYVTSGADDSGTNLKFIKLFLVK